MAAEIKRLLSETAEKARMESELKTAQVVQSTLFPTGDLVHSDLEIRGFYQSASECGGDWWFYSEVGSKVYFWIGDATGHGVPAALVTSAAKSAAGILEKFPDLPLDRVMELFNSAIYGTSHGTVMMTFFLGCFDRDSMQFEYCNASHDPPFLMRPQEGKKLKKKDLTPLMEKIGKRLGETPDSQYEKVSIDLSPGDRIPTDKGPEVETALRCQRFQPDWSRGSRPSGSLTTTELPSLSRSTYTTTLVPPSFA